MTNLDKIVELNRDKIIDAIQSLYCINPETFELTYLSNGFIDMGCYECIWHKMAEEQGGMCDDYSAVWLNKEIEE